MNIENPRQAHADYCARADGHDGACEAPDWYPRQEADEPRVPELWWSPAKREVYWLPDPTATNVWTLELVDESLPSDELPADAVKLGDVEDAEAAAEKLRDYLVGANKTIERRGRERDEARRERDALRERLAESLKVRRDLRRKAISEQAGKVCAERERDALRAQLNRARAALHDWSEHDEIRDILDREPGREQAAGYRDQVAEDFGRNASSEPAPREPGREEPKGGEPCPGDPKPAATDVCSPCVAGGVCQRPTASDCIAVTREHEPAGVNNPTPVDQQDDQAGQ